MQLTVLYDDRRPLCRTFSTWLARQACLVDLDLVPAGAAAHRALAEGLARPSRLPLAKGAAYLAAGIRNASLSRLAAPGGDYPDDCAGTCAPIIQG